MEGVSDLSRNDRQQYIILQLLEEIKNFSSLGELSTLINTLEDAFVIDENLSLNNAVNILWNFRESNLSDINKLSIPVNPYELDDGRQVLIITENFSDYAELEGLKNS
jgi:anionic cell wall polymer biosynthesis LytR-Cps2A-Psr (LCP) family protein